MLDKIAEGAYNVRNGLCQILFVTSGRFTKEEINAYSLLRSVIFDEKITKYVTVVRTNFPSFLNATKCEEDKKAMIGENKDLKEVILYCNKVIHIDNPSVSIDDERRLALNMEDREESRKKIMTHLRNCRENYKPKSLDKLNERIKGYMTEAERLQSQLNKMEEKAKKMEEKFGEASDEVKKVRDSMKLLEAKHQDEKRKMAEEVDRRINEVRNAVPQKSAETRYETKEIHHHHYIEKPQKSSCKIM